MEQYVFHFVAPQGYEVVGLNSFRAKPVICSITFSNLSLTDMDVRIGNCIACTGDDYRVTIWEPIDDYEFEIYDELIS